MTATVDLHGYAIPLLHAAKHPSQRVCGLLLGKVKDDKVTEINTAVPLFHHWTTLTPMLEMALQQVELYGKKKQLEIVGWYQANDRVDDLSLAENAIKVADTIRQRSKAARVFVLNNAKLGSMEKATDGFVIYDHSEQQWQKCQKDQVDQDYLPKFRGLLSSAGYRRVVDLDDHLENVALDWLATSEMKL